MAKFLHMKSEVKIRFNTDFLNPKRWRVIIGDNQEFVDEVDIRCKSYSTEDIVKNEENISVKKYHISCVPKSITFSRTKTKTKITLK